jgi:alpha-tubulin suppressor-like RCC1 family protein
MVYGWGDNQQGQLGSRSLGNIVLEPKLLKIKNVIEISANRNISVFLKGMSIVMKMNKFMDVEEMILDN